MNLIFEFMGMYLMIGIMAYGIYFVVGTIYLIAKLHPNTYAKARLFKSRVVKAYAKTEQSKSDIIGRWLIIIFLWPYVITRGSYRIYSEAKNMTA